MTEERRAEGRTIRAWGRPFACACPTSIKDGGDRSRRRHQTSDLRIRRTALRRLPAARPALNRWAIFTHNQDSTIKKGGK